jgi:hypothetical protein
VWYSYAIIRVVPRVERGEFVNVGVIVYVPESAFLAARVELSCTRLETMLRGIGSEEVERRLAAIVGVAAGDVTCGPMAAMPASERFHWLTAPRSTVIQTSLPHDGRTDDPLGEVERLMDAFVRVSDE